MNGFAATRLGRFIRARLTPHGELGLHLTLGGLALVAALWIFAGIAEDVMGAEAITLLDVRVAQWLHAHATDGLTRCMLAVSYLHGVTGMLLLSALLGGYFFLKNAHYWLLALALSVPGGMLLNVLLKLLFARARPSFSDPILTLATYSFPSGHAVAATLLYGLIAAYLVGRTRRWGARAVIVAGAVLLVLLVGLSRMVLGVHFLSDVLAAMAEGCAWLAICITACSTLRRRRARRDNEKGKAC